MRTPISSNFFECRVKFSFQFGFCMRTKLKLNLIPHFLLREQSRDDVLNFLHTAQLFNDIRVVCVRLVHFRMEISYKYSWCRVALVFVQQLLNSFDYNFIMQQSRQDRYLVRLKSASISCQKRACQNHKSITQCQRRTCGISAKKARVKIVQGLFSAKSVHAVFFVKEKRLRQAICTQISNATRRQVSLVHNEQWGIYRVSQRTI